METYAEQGENGEGAITHGGPGSADGKLMQAAPELYEALRAIDTALKNGELKFSQRRQADSDPYHPALVKLVAALAKVED